MKGKTVVPVLLAALLFAPRGTLAGNLVLPEVSSGKLLPMSEPIPSFSLPDAASGQTLEFRALVKGKTVILTYMQTACSSCKTLMDSLHRLQGRQPGVTVIAVAVDIGGPDRILTYAKYFNYGGITFLHDPQMKSAPLMGVTFTPATFLIDREGTIRTFMAGFDEVSFKGLEGKVNELAR